MATTPSTETIALLLPTRKRPPLLVRFWESVAATAEHPELVTVVLVVDEDDPETLQVVNNLSGLKKCLLVGPPSALAVEKWTRAFCATRCDFSMLCGDDLVFRTSSWDTSLKDAFSSWPDRLGMIYFRDGVNDQTLAAHPVVHRRWVDVLGYYLPPGFKHFFIDRWTHDLAVSVGRCRYLGDVHVEHLHYCRGKADFDATYQRSQPLMYPELAVYQEQTPRRMSDIERLRTAIEHGTIIEREFQHAASSPSDINEHLPILRDYARQCRCVTEFGVRWAVSSWGLLAGFPQTMRSYDLVRHSNVAHLETTARGAGVAFSFHQEDTRFAAIEPTDLLFIDTFHSKEHVTQELACAARVSKYLIFHDTVLFGERGADGKDGLLPGIREFLSNHRDWRTVASLTNCNGLMVLERLS